MFWQGFIFSLGFTCGCVVFSVLLVGTVLAIEQLREFFQKPRKMDGTINIRQWQQRAQVRRNAREDFRPAS